MPDEHAFWRDKTRSTQQYSRIRVRHETESNQATCILFLDDAISLHHQRLVQKMLPDTLPIQPEDLDFATEPQYQPFLRHPDADEEAQLSALVLWQKTDLELVLEKLDRTLAAKAEY